MDYFVVSSDYPELYKAVEEIFINVDTVNVVASNAVADRRICDILTSTSVSANHYYTIN